VDFALHLRIPGWCERPELKINGKPHHLASIADGFVVIDRKYAPGDVIDLALPMPVAAGHSSDGGIFLERGPLVFSFRPQEEWTSLFMPEFEITSPDFPMWAAATRSRWNFALFLDEKAPLGQQVRVNVTPTTADPWLNPPISLNVSARLVSDWDLVRPQGDNSDWFVTPPLPAAPRHLGPEETITLVPLGSTHLRLTVFPSCSSFRAQEAG